MKALGIVRKIDNLGRLVIPKEVRDSQGWYDGQPLEMFMSKDGLVVKGYRETEERKNAIKLLENAIRFSGNSEVRSDLIEVVNYLEGK